jgi:predicted permease
VRPALGRFFLPEEEHTPGAHPVIVLSDGFWRRRFGGDPAVVGKPVLVDGEPYTVVGVAPAGFSGIYPVVRTDAWVPLMMAGQLGREEGILTNAGAGWLSLFGRLKDGVSEAQGRADLASIAAAHVAEEPKDLQVFTDVSLTPFTGFPPFASGALISFAALLLAVSALVLVIAGVNVAGMLLARAMARRREMAVRTALGASRGRLVRQMLTESALLFSGGAVGGLLIAYGGARLLGRFQLPAEVPLAFDLDPDVRVLVFCLATALATGLFFGLAPALQAARRDPGVSLRSDTAGAGAHRSRLRSALVVGQMALSLLLLMTAGLFLRALDKGRSVPTGFDTSHVATAPIDVSTAGYPDARARLFYDALKARLLAAPGVTAVSYTRILPLTFSNSAESFRVEGYTPPAERSRDGMVDVHFAIVAPGYFDVLRIPLVRGRAFTDADAAASPHVAVVNESFVARYWPGTDPIGRTLNDGQVTVTVVGVARDVK